MDNCSNFLSSLPDNISDAEIWSLLLEDERKEAVTKIPAFVYMALLIILGLPGNVIVLIVYKSRFRPSTTKCFIMAMAAFDLCSCLLAMPFEIVDIRLDFELDIPVGCRVMRFLVAVFAYGSILVLIGVAVDRFQRVCRPYSRQMTVKNSKTGIAVMIGIAVTFSLPNLIFYGRQTVKFRSLTLVDCSIDDQFSESVLPKIYFVFQGLCWVLAILVLSITYGFIIYNIKKANQRRYRLDSSTSTNTVNHVGMSNMNSGPHRKNSVQKLPVGTSLENTALSSKTKTKTKTRSNSTCSNSGKDDRQTEKQGKATQANTGNKGDKSNNSPKSNPGTPRRSSNWKSNAFMRLFSRDVNPVDLVDQPEDALQTPTSRGSSISVTLHEREEEILSSGLQDVEEERNGMEDGVSLQNLIPDENSSDDAPEESTSTVSGTPKKSLGTIHISASEGDHLADSEGLNNYHKLLSESLQGLNEMKTDSEFNGLEGCRLTHRPKSMDHLSCKTKSDQLNTADVSSVCDTETEGSTNFRRSKTFPVRKNSSLTNPEGSRKSTHSDENDKSIRENEDIALEIDKNDTTIPPKKESTFTKSNSDDKNDKNPKSLTGSFNVSQTSDVDKASPNEDHRDSKDRLANSPQGSSDVKKKEVNNTNSILSPSKDSSQKQTKPNNNNNNNKSNNAPRKTSRSASFQRQISSCSTDITSSKSAVVKRKQMKELKTSKLAMMMFHVTLGFVISYLPHLSIQIAKILHPDGVSALMCDAYFFGFYHVALRSIYLNHTINPLIYGYYNKRFRQYCVGFLTSPLRFLRKSPSSVPDRSSISMEQT